MAEPLETAAGIFSRLFAPQNLPQIVVMLAALALGLWAGRLLQRRIAPANTQDDLRGRLRESEWVAAPYAVVLLVLAASAGLMHALGKPAQLVVVQEHKDSDTYANIAACTPDESGAPLQPSGMRPQFRLSALQVSGAQVRQRSPTPLPRASR